MSFFSLFESLLVLVTVARGGACSTSSLLLPLQQQQQRLLLQVQLMLMLLKFEATAACCCSRCIKSSCCCSHCNSSRYCCCCRCRCCSCNSELLLQVLLRFFCVVWFGVSGVSGQLGVWGSVCFWGFCEQREASSDACNYAEYRRLHQRRPAHPFALSPRLCRQLWGGDPCETNPKPSALSSKP